MYLRAIDIEAGLTTGGETPHHGVHVSDLRPGRFGARAFAVPSTSKRFRRPTDVVLLALSLVLIAVTAEQLDDPGRLETTFAGWLAALPALLDFVWAVAYDLAQIWIVVIAALAGSADAGGCCATGR